MSDRTRRSLVRLGKLVAFGVLGALVVLAQQVATTGQLSLNPSVVLVAVIAAAAGALEKWLTWEESQDPVLQNPSVPVAPAPAEAAKSS